MPRDADLYDVFVSYARADNGQGWITQFVDELVAEHRKFSGGRELGCFFDRREIGSLDDWRHRIYGSLARSRLFLAFLSPRYFASPWCRREWRAWIDTEIAKHVLSSGAAPIYLVEVPGFDGPGDEQEVARRVARLCELPLPHEAFARAAAPVVKQLRRRQFNAVQPFYRAGLQATNRLVDAEPLMRRALTINESSYGPYHPGVATGLNNLAQLLQATNRLVDAEPLMRRALAIDESSYGPDHPKVAIRLNNLAQLLQATSRLAEAEPLMRRALAIAESSYGPDHPVVATALNNLAWVLQYTNRLAEAEPLFRRALAIDESSYGPDHPDVATDLNGLALLLRATKRLGEAEPLLRRAVEILRRFEANTGHQHPNLQAVAGNHAAIVRQMGS